MNEKDTMYDLPTQIAMRVNACLDSAEKAKKLKVRRLLMTDIPTLYLHLGQGLASTVSYTGGDKDKAYKLVVNLDPVMAPDVAAMIDDVANTFRIHDSRLEAVERRFKFCKATLTVTDGTVLYGNLDTCELRA